MSLLDLMLKRDAAELDMKQTVALFRTLTTTLPPQVFCILPPSWKRDAERLARQGLITLPPDFEKVTHE